MGFAPAWGPGDGAERAWRAPIGDLPTERFCELRQLLFERSGAWLKTSQLQFAGGLVRRRMRALGIARHAEYFTHLRSPQAKAEWELLIEACTADPAAAFFADWHYYEFVAQRLLPRWVEEAKTGLRPRRVRAWSLGGGEQTYSVAMTLLHGVDTNWEIEVLGTDTSARRVAEAASGRFPKRAASEIPHELLQEFMLSGDGEHAGAMRAAPRLLTSVSFAHFNPLMERWPVEGLYDVIFCDSLLRGVAPAIKPTVMNKIGQHLAPHGLLFTSADEAAALPRMRILAPSIYGQAADNGRLLADFRSLSRL
jgi:chemotaxis protein methyltransferase CheR